MVARVVQFSETHYSKEGIFLEFLVDVLRPVIVEDGYAIDIFSHQVFEIVPMVDGYIGVDVLGRLDRDALYAYEVYDATYPKQYLPMFFEKALETYRWYHEEYCIPSQEKVKTYGKIIPFEEVRAKWEEKKNPPKGK